ncbi:mannan endo-1,4-beta-mannosidase 1 [Iris pallida]|uniref:Mannan endo-1,4-beta-mannosidase 1 n=1 Tax=Iris pallida TaxID=29817 RepID=A0AAX6HAM9_IRIPA|nr:mannan endo-1,4-beta-mannosidase 1 [Iris pallida]
MSAEVRMMERVVKRGVLHQRKLDGPKNASRVRTACHYFTSDRYSNKVASTSTDVPAKSSSNKYKGLIEKVKGFDGLVNNYENFGGKGQYVQCARS